MSLSLLIPVVLSSCWMVCEMKMSGRTASRIRSNHHAASLYSFHLDFSQSVLLVQVVQTYSSTNPNTA